MFEKLHSIGKIYNDLKLDNLVVGDNSSIGNSVSDLYLIDFGLCTDYLTAEGKHIEFGYTSEFIGNLALSSKNAMNFCTVSRRDDLIQLSYMLVYMVNGHLDFLKLADNQTNHYKVFSKICKFKNKQTPEELCSSSKA